MSVASDLADLRAKLTRRLPPNRGAAADTGSPAPKPPRPPVSATGVEVDGTTLRVVEVRKGRVCSYVELVGETLEDALAAWGRPRRSAGAVRVSWSSGMQVARSNIPNVPASVRRLAIADAAEAMFPASGGTLVTAGAAGVAGPDAQTVPATLVAVRRDTIAAAGKTLAARKAELLAAPLTLSSDGLYLVMGTAGAALSLVEAGTTIAYREVASGAPAWGSPGLSEADVSGYLSRMIPEVSATVASWGSRGQRVPSNVFVAGPGSRVSMLGRALGSVGLRPDAPPTPEGINHYDLPASEIAAAYVAICAAAAPEDPSIRLVDTAAVAERSASAAGARRRKTAVAVATAAAVAVAAGAFALVSAGQQLSSAKAAEASAAAQAQAVSKWTALAGKVAAFDGAAAGVAKDDAHYPARLAVLFATAPSGTTYASVSTQAASGAVTVNVSADVPGTTFTPIAAWVSRLEAAGATTVNAENFSASKSRGYSSVTLTATINPPKPKPAASKG